MKILASTSLLLFFASPPIHGASDRPGEAAVHCDSPFYYVGTTETERSFKVDRVFRIANRTPSSVRIASAEASCGCSKASRNAYDFQYSPEIPARSWTGLRIGYQTAPLAGVPDIREFEVRFEKNQARPVNLTVVAKRLDELTLFPGRDIILRREAGRPATKTLYLVAKELKDLRSEPADPAIPGISIALTPVQEADQLRLPASVWSNGSVLALRIEAAPSAGTANATIRLKTNHPSWEEIALRLAVF